MNFSQKFQK